MPVFFFSSVQMSQPRPNGTQDATRTYAFLYGFFFFLSFQPILVNENKV